MMQTQDRLTDSSCRVLLYETLDSTNEEAKRLMNTGALNGLTLIRAASQTVGKGTQGRKWVSPSGSGLYMSVVHPIPYVSQRGFPLPMTPVYTLAAGVACAETLRELLGLEIALKPVNDLYLGGRKLGGILVESLVSGEHCRALITGIGINVLEDANIAAACLHDGRGNQPTSLQANLPPAIFNRWTPEALLSELSLVLGNNVDNLYHLLATQGEASIQARYQALMLSGVEPD